MGSVLAVDRVGLDDDFFDLGGDSLAAIELMVAIDEHFGIDLPPSTLLEAPTTAALAPLLNRRRPRSASTVSSRSGAVPARPSSALREAALPRPRSACWRTHFPTIVPATASRPAGSRSAPVPTGASRRVRAATWPTSAPFSPSVPYLLGGHSFGGLVAFEMACRLEAAGEHVALAGAPRHPRARHSSADSLSANACGELREETTFALKARRLGESAIGHAQLEFELASAGLVPRRLRQYRVFFLLSRRMARRYRTHSTVTAPILVVRATHPRSRHAEPRVAQLGVATVRRRRRSRRSRSPERTPGSCVGRTSPSSRARSARHFDAAAT